MFLSAYAHSTFYLDVFFDDFGVEHVKSPVVQMDDYYPFGLTFNNYQRENSLQFASEKREIETG